MAGWAETVERIRATPGIEHRSANDEWSAVQTLRHLVFVHDSWFRRCVLGSTAPFTPMGLGSSSSPTVRSRGSTAPPTRVSTRCSRCGPQQAAELEAWLAGVTPEQLAGRRPCPTARAGRRTPVAGACASASARCSTRSSSTTASACATWRSWQRLPRLSRVDRVSEMTYRPLGDSGLMVSAVGIGCNAFGRRVDLDGVREILDAAQDVGVTLLDTADVYGGQGASEQMLGEALQGRRDEFVVATKFGMDMQGANGPDRGARGSRAYVRRAVESSLRRLRTDYLDLYQYHEPDGVTPIEETLSVLTDLVREGKVRYVGCLQRRRLAGGRRRLDRPLGRLRALRLRPEPLLPAGPHGRGRGRAGLRAVRARPAALLPARVRPAHRQVPPRRGGPGRLARRRRALSLARARTDWDRIERVDGVRRGARRLACSTSRSPASPPSRRSLGDLRAPPAGSRCARTPSPCGGSPARPTSPSSTRSPGADEPA